VAICTYVTGYSLFDRVISLLHQEKYVFVDILIIYLYLFRFNNPLYIPIFYLYHHIFIYPTSNIHLYTLSICLITGWHRGNTATIRKHNGTVDIAARRTGHPDNQTSKVFLTSATSQRNQRGRERALRDSIALGTLDNRVAHVGRIQSRGDAIDTDVVGQKTSGQCFDRVGYGRLGRVVCITERHAVEAGNGASDDHLSTRRSHDTDLRSRASLVGGLEKGQECHNSVVSSGHVYIQNLGEILHWDGKQCIAEFRQGRDGPVRLRR